MSFTSDEYIQKHKLGINVRDPHAMRMLTNHLNDKGYVKRRVNGKYVWLSKSEISDYDALKAKLEKIK